MCHCPSLAELTGDKPSSPDPARNHVVTIRVGTTWRRDCNDNAGGLQEIAVRRYAGDFMSKKTKKRKARLRRSKANHGKRPNTGRG